MELPENVLYAPGDVTLVCVPRWIALVDLPADDPLATRLYETMRTGDMDDALDVLVSPGLRAIKSFALAAWGDAGCRLIVRGAFSVDGPDGPLLPQGLWADSSAADPLPIHITAAETDGPWLPLASGIVRAAAARVGTPVSPATVDQVSADADVASEPDPAPVVEPEPAPGPEPEPAPAAEPEPAPAVLEPAPAIPEPVPLAPAQPSGLLIESFPWAVPSDDWVTPTPVPATSPAESHPDATDDEVLEMTVDRRNLVGHAGLAETMVVAAKCPSGHLTPAYAGRCRVCGQTLPPQQPFETPRPPLGILRLSNGDSVTLDRGVVMGRNPHLPSGYVGEQPNLIKLSDPQKDISSQHLEISLDFWHVMVTDLGSTNGTEVVLPGQPGVQLTPHDPMMIEPGTRVILAGVQDFVFEVTG